MDQSKLLTELIKQNDDLQKIEFTFKGTDFVWYFRYLTLLEKVRIQQMCIKPNTTLHSDGSTTTEMKEQEHLVPIHTILEKALDKDGKQIFSHAVDFNTISKLPAGVASRVAYQMSTDIFGTMKKEDSDNG